MTNHQVTVMFDVELSDSEIEAFKNFGEELRLWQRKLQLEKPSVGVKVSRIQSERYTWHPMESR